MRRRKKCPQCMALIHAAYQTCPECGWKFPPPEKNNITETASTEGIISGEVTRSVHNVQSTHYALHEKRDADPNTPRTMRIDYEIAFNQYVSEWVCPEHTGYAREKFVKWWLTRAPAGCPVPQTAREAVQMAGEGCLAKALAITVKRVAGERFEQVTKCRIGPKPAWTPKPAMIPEPGWNDPIDDPPAPELVSVDDGSDIPF